MEMQDVWVRSALAMSGPMMLYLSLKRWRTTYTQYRQASTASLNVEASHQNASKISCVEGWFVTDGAVACCAPVPDAASTNPR